MSIRSWLRNYLLSKEERDALLDMEALIYPERHLYGRDGVWNPANPECLLLTWEGSKPFGWLESVSVKGEVATINHFALNKEFTGVGLGYRLASSFAQALKQNAGVSCIKFTEYTQSDAHDRFFTKSLGAIKEESPNKGIYHWIWQIP